jgi:hypothetical protein
MYQSGTNTDDTNCSSAAGNPVSGCMPAALPADGTITFYDCYGDGGSGYNGNIVIIGGVTVYNMEEFGNSLVVNLGDCSVDPVYGCMDDDATNFNPLATSRGCAGPRTAETRTAAERLTPFPRQ